MYGPGTVAFSRFVVSARASFHSSTMPSPSGAVTFSITSNGVFVSQSGAPSFRGGSSARRPVSRS